MTSPRYECTLSATTLQKAVEELNEPDGNELRLKAIDRLRARFLSGKKGDHFIRTDDAFLLRFLRFRKFKEDRALRALMNYYDLRKAWRDVFNLVENPRTFGEFLDIGSVVPSKQRAKDGSFVSICRLGRNFNQKWKMKEWIADMVLSTETLLEDEEMQIYGLTIINDLEYFGVGLAMQMTLVAKKFMQDTLPIRIKSLDVVNEAFAFDVIFSVIRPFMSEKLRSRLHLHGSQLKGLQEKIGKEILPSFLGGTGPELDAGWWKGEILKVDSSARE